MKKYLYTVEETAEMIKAGKKLVVAGDMPLLEQLPEGDWIGGTSPYFMTPEGGKIIKDKIFVSDLTDSVSELMIKTYDAEGLKNVYTDGYEDGYTFLIIPPYSVAQERFAFEAPSYEGFASKPLCGWVAAHEFDQRQIEVGKTYCRNGQSGSAELAVAMHVKLPANKYAEMNLVNFYEPREDITVEFTETSLTVRNVIVNGKEVNFAKYIKENNLDPDLPIMTDAFSQLTNVSIHMMTEDTVTVFAPVFQGIPYKIAKPVDNLPQKMLDYKNPDSESPDAGCMCMLCYLRGEQEGKVLDNIYVPVTLGEICYQLVNQSVITFSIKNA